MKKIRYQIEVYCDGSFLFWDWYYAETIEKVKENFFKECPNYKDNPKYRVEFSEE